MTLLKTYTVLFAEDVPHYGTAEIAAPDDDAARSNEILRLEYAHQ